MCRRYVIYFFMIFVKNCTIDSSGRGLSIPNQVASELCRVLICWFSYCSLFSVSVCNIAYKSLVQLDTDQLINLKWQTKQINNKILTTQPCWVEGCIKNTDMKRKVWLMKWPTPNGNNKCRQIIQTPNSQSSKIRIET